jgi:hypothetical protein
MRKLEQTMATRHFIRHRRLQTAAGTFDAAAERRLMRRVTILCEKPA